MNAVPQRTESLQRPVFANPQVATRGVGSALRTVYAGGPALPRDMQALLDRIP